MSERVVWEDTKFNCKRKNLTFKQIGSLKILLFFFRNFETESLKFSKCCSFKLHFIKNPEKHRRLGGHLGTISSDVVLYIGNHRKQVLAFLLMNFSCHLVRMGIPFELYHRICSYIHSQSIIYNGAKVRQYIHQVLS